MSYIAIRRYGAIELKMAYQHNMALAMLLVISFTAFITGLIYLLAGEPPVQIIIKKPLVDEYHIIPTPPPVINIEPPTARGRTRSAPPGNISSNLIPIDDDEALDPNEGRLYTRDELYTAADGYGSGEGDIDDGIMIGSGGGGGEYIEPQEKFVACEIPPEIIITAKPEYPRQARLVGISATVWVRILVDEEGNAADAVVYKSSGSNAGFDEAALAAALKCKFKPGIQNGEAVKVWVSLKFEFDIND